jgi:predicted Zn-dependent protease with MMP-like domain
LVPKAALIVYPSGYSRKDETICTWIAPNGGDSCGSARHGSDRRILASDVDERSHLDHRGTQIWCESGGKVGLMADTTNPESFEEIVEWAYSTLPQKIRDLPDFPGIQVVDEPPADVLEDISNRKKWRRGTELLGLYSGTLRTKRSYTQVKYAPDLIFVFRGPILRCSKGDLRAAVKRVVWHEVAHWLGYETEEQVKDLGL